MWALGFELRLKFETSAFNHWAILLLREFLVQCKQAIFGLIVSHGEEHSCWLHVEFGGFVLIQSLELAVLVTVFWVPRMQQSLQ